MGGLAVTASQQGASDKGVLLANNAEQDANAEAEAGGAGRAGGLDLEMMEVRVRHDGKGERGGESGAQDDSRAPPTPDEDELELDYGSDEVLLDESGASH